MTTQAHTDHSSSISLDSFEQDLINAFSVDAGDLVRHNNSSQSQKAGAQTMNSGAFLASEASCSFNLYNAHITREYLKKISTHIEPDSPCWAVYINDFGNGVAEAVATKQLEKPFRRKKGNVVKVVQGDDYTRADMDEEQLHRSIIRAKKNARYKALGLGVDRLLTFTTRENIQDRDLAYKYLEKTIKLYNSKSNKKLQYVAVMELQKRGAIHFHLATNEYHDVVALRKCWMKAIGGDGTVNVTNPKNYQRSKDGHWNRADIVKYITKYISKDYDKNNIVGKKRYSSSRGILKPMKHIIYIPLGDNTFRIVLALIKEYTGADMQRWSGIPNMSTNMTWFSTY